MKDVSMEKEEEKDISPEKNKSPRISSRNKKKHKDTHAQEDLPAKIRKDKKTKKKDKDKPVPPVKEITIQLTPYQKMMEEKYGPKPTDPKLIPKHGWYTTKVWEE
jgi:hypothetical protein